MKEGWEFGWMDYAYIIGVSGVVSFYAIDWTLKFFGVISITTIFIKGLVL